MLQLIPLTNPLLLKAYNAAFAEKSLSTAEVNKYNVVEAVDALVEVYENLGPRSVAHVLLGAAKIYGLQVDALHSAVRKEVQHAQKQESFQRPKELHVAETTLASASATKALQETPKETLLQLEPVSVEAPRLQAREEDISFEEWRDASVRSSLLSRSSDRIPRSERFLQDLGVDQNNMLEMEDFPADIPPPDLDLPAGEKENLDQPVIKPVRNTEKAFVRIDPTTQLTKKAVKHNLTATSDIVQFPAFQGPKHKALNLTGPSSLLCSSLSVLMESSAYKALQEPPPLEPVVPDEPFPDPPPTDVYEEQFEAPPSPRASVPASHHESDETEQELLSQRSRKMLVFLQGKMRSTKKLSFETLTKGKPQQLKASSLFEMLHLTQQGYITLSQTGDFGDIIVRPTNLFAG